MPITRSLPPTCFDNSPHHPYNPDCFYFPQSTLPPQEAWHSLGFSRCIYLPSSHNRKESISTNSRSKLSHLLIQIDIIHVSQENISSALVNYSKFETEPIALRIEIRVRTINPALHKLRYNHDLRVVSVFCAWHVIQPTL